MKFENTEVWGFKHAFRGMRNPMNSHNKSDSYFGDECHEIVSEIKCTECLRFDGFDKSCADLIGENDLKLARKLIKAGTEHRKFLRQIFVSVDITAPLYWWKEFDTYRIGTTANSTSTMHKLISHEFTPDMFEISNLCGYKKYVNQEVNLDKLKEVWKQYPYGDLYLISNYGRTKRKSYTTSNNHNLPEIILNWQLSKDGYAYVGVSTEKTGYVKKNRRVHVLVAETFIKNDNPSEKTQVNHIDGNKLNNHVSNLEWVTPKENCIDRSNNNLQPKGIYTYKGKLSKEQREEILFRLNTEDVSRRKLAKEYGVTHSTINSIVSEKYDYGENYINEYDEFLKIIDRLNLLRDEYLETGNKSVWKQIVIELPESFLQTRTVTMSYENILNMYNQRKNHKLNEWSGKDDNSKSNFISWAETLPFFKVLFLDEEVVGENN